MRFKNCFQGTQFPKKDVLCHTFETKTVIYVKRLPAKHNYKLKQPMSFVLLMAGYVGALYVLPLHWPWCDDSLDKTAFSANLCLCPYLDIEPLRYNNTATA